MNLTSWLSTLQFALVYAMFALSVYAMLSAGVFSVSSIASGAVGGFLFGKLASSTSVPPGLVLVLAALAGAAFSYALSLVLVRLESHYLALVTIALLLVVNVVVLNLDSVTGGVNGTVVPSWYGWLHLIGLLAFFGYVFSRLRGSRVGLAGATVREDPLVAGALGINRRHVERTAIVIAGAVGGVAGVFLASLVSFIDPSTYYVQLAFLTLSAVVLGGAYHWQGAIIGALIFTLLPHALQGYISPTAAQLVNGLVIIAIVLLLPRGLVDPERLRGLTDRARALRRRSVEPTPQDSDSATERVHAGVGTVDPGIGRNGASRDPAEAARDSAALEVVAISKSFGGVSAVDGVTATVRPGQIFGVLGPNGAGKTTLINLLSGVMLPDSGNISLHSECITGTPSHERARRGLARTYQNIRLAHGFTTLETVVSGCYIRGRSGVVAALACLPYERAERRQLAEEARALLDQVGVTSPPERIARTLSYGEQRRVEIARALAIHPSVLLLDEPTAGMNVQESQAIGELLWSLTGRGITVVLIEHNMRLVRDYCDHAIVMDAGALIAEGTPAECLSSPVVQDAYFGRSADAERIQALRQLRIPTSS